MFFSVVNSSPTYSVVATSEIVSGIIIIIRKYGSTFYIGIAMVV